MQPLDVVFLCKTAKLGAKCRYFLALGTCHCRFRFSKSQGKNKKMLLAYVLVKNVSLEKCLEFLKEITKIWKRLKTTEGRQFKKVESKKTDASICLLLFFTNYSFCFDNSIFIII